jgi:hypothetical protein
VIFNEKPLFSDLVQFTFYKLVAWFNDRHAHALQLQSEGKIWAPTP